MGGPEYRVAFAPAPHSTPLQRYLRLVISVMVELGLAFALGHSHARFAGMPDLSTHVAT